MSKIKPIQSIKTLSGKIAQNSDMMFVTNSQTEEVPTWIIGQRDLQKHPVTNREKELHSKMHDGIMAYHALKDNMESYAAFLEQFNKAKQQGYNGNAYHYFLHLYMPEGKNSQTIKIAKKHSREKDFVKALQLCTTQAEALTLLVTFIDTLGYHSLAQTYNQSPIF